MFPIYRSIMKYVAGDDGMPTGLETETETVVIAFVRTLDGAKQFCEDETKKWNAYPENRIKFWHGLQRDVVILPEPIALRRQ